jgi:cupin 2 domain-containing protein
MSRPEVRSLLDSSFPSDGEGERFESLLSGESFRLERILSRGTASPPDFWYDQSEEEWVLLVSGQARLEFEGEGMVDLCAGDALRIPARCRHRVASVSGDAVWLALHFSRPASA